MKMLKVLSLFSGIGAFEKIRYNKSVSVKFDKEDNIESKEDLGM